MNLLEQEKKYQFDVFPYHRGLEFGLIVLELVKERNLKNVRIRVRVDNDIVFQYLMDGKKGERWLELKENTVLYTGHSSLYASTHFEEYPELQDKTRYAGCGGGFPLLINESIRGVFCISGLKDTEDHQLIIAALERMRTA